MKCVRPLKKCKWTLRRVGLKYVPKLGKNGQILDKLNVAMYYSEFNFVILSI
jgi:hypothetical protein